MITIITDSASDISQEEAESLHIRVLPITIIFDGKDYLDSVTISQDEFYQRLTVDKEFPKTAQINPACFQKAFQEEVDKGNEVLCITLGAKLSGTYQSANIAAMEFQDKVLVVDSDNVCIAERNLVYLAIQDIQKGMSLKDIREHLDQKKKDLVIMAAVDTLEYLERGGRISKAAAFFGNMLSIKPVVAVKEGEVKLIGKARGYKNAHNLLTQLLKKGTKIDFSLPYAVAYSGNDKSLLNKYLETNKELYQDKNLPIYRIGPTIGTHIGDGAVAVSFFKEDGDDE